jgi:hypothetical protein
MAVLEVQGGNVPSRTDFPAHDALVVTPSDSTVVAFRSLWIGGTGNANVVPLNAPTDAGVLFSAIPAGTLLPIAVRKVLLTSTTATLIVGMI